MTDTEALTSQQVYDKIVAALPSDTDLYYVEYNDTLREEQADQALQSANGFMEVQNEIMDLWAEEHFLSTERTLQEAAEAVGLRDEFEDLDDDWVSRLREQVWERDRSNPMKDLARNVRTLLRFQLGADDVDQDLPYNTGYPASPDEEVVDKHGRRLARMAGVDFDVNADAFRQMVIEQSYYGGNLFVFWYGTISEFLDAVLDENGVHTITWTDPYLVLFDGMNGTGHDARITGTITRTFRPGLLGLDSQGGQGGWDNVAGLYRPAYANDPTVRRGVNLSKEITA